MGLRGVIAKNTMAAMAIKMAIRISGVSMISIRSPVKLLNEFNGDWGNGRFALDVCRYSYFMVDGSVAEVILGP